MIHPSSVGLWKQKKLSSSEACHPFSHQFSSVIKKKQQQTNKAHASKGDVAASKLVNTLYYGHEEVMERNSVIYLRGSSFLLGQLLRKEKKGKKNQLSDDEAIKVIPRATIL